jgi:hypothetical protein
MAGGKVECNACPVTENPELVRSLPDALAAGPWHDDGAPTGRRFEALDPANPWPLGRAPMPG